MTIPHSNDTPSNSDEHDRLLSRIVDGEATGEDWEAFRAVAADNQEVWGELSQTQQTQGVLADAVRSRAAIADSVELPEEYAEPEHLQHRFDLVSRWGGWAAAAAIVLVWMTGGLPTTTSPGNQAGLGPGILLSEASPDQALDQYINAGQAANQVVTELPDPIVVEHRPMSDGSTEVLYIRQFLVRKVVSQVLTQTRDDLGRPITTPAEIQPATTSSY